MKKLNSMILLLLLLAGIAFGMSNLTISNAQVETDPHVRVSWTTVNQTSELGHTEQNSHWFFGPQPIIWVSYADNGTDIAKNNFRVEEGTDLYINITIPKSFLGVGNELDVVRFWGSTVSQRTIFVFEYNATDDRWSEVTLHYEPRNDTPSQKRFISLNETMSKYEEDSDYYRIAFACRFDEKIVETVFWTGMQAIDTMGRPVSPSWLARLQQGGYESPPLGLATDVDPREFSLPDYYYADIVNEDEQIMHYAGVNDTFIVRMMSTTEFGEILLPFATLTFESNYTIMGNISMPVGWPDSMWDPDAVWDEIITPLRPTLFFKLNSTDIYALAGYYNITWSWIKAAEGIGFWYPAFHIIENSTIDVSKYYTTNSTYTGIFDDGHRVQWGGYFTNYTDMNNDHTFGGIIKPDMGLTQVLDKDGEPIDPRPEISDKETMKLAYRADFVEVFVYDEYGNIADIAMQGDILNMTILVHKPEIEVNGSYIYDNVGLTWNITQRLTNFSIRVEGSGMDSNETHYWRNSIYYDMVLEAGTDISSSTTTYRQLTYLKGGQLVDTLEIVTDLWDVEGFNIDIDEEMTTVNVFFNFSDDAPSMVFNQAYIKAGLMQNVRIWNPNNNSWCGIWWNPEAWDEVKSEWVDRYFEIDLSSESLWSPRHLILGDLNIWKPPIWTVTDEGAIDLDGNVYTTDDQYFVKRTGFWEDEGNVTLEGMWVNVVFDPSPHPDYQGDEFHSNSWMGVSKLIIKFSANETFYWYHASDMTPIGEAEISEIRDLLWAEQPSEGKEGKPIPGYEYVAWLSINRTIDLSGIPGLESGYWSNAWFAWGTEQHFLVSTSVTQQMWAQFTAQYAGLLMFNDDPYGNSPDAPDFSIIEGAVVTEEVTHVVLIDDIDSIELRRPFGSDNLTGSVIVNTTTPITFGISIYDVSVTAYPLQIEHSDGIRGPWNFRQSYEGAIGLNSTNFDYWITTASIDEMAFDISFDVDLVEWDSEDLTTWNHAVAFKVDQTIGNWTLDDFDNSVLEDRGLSVNFFGVLRTIGRTQYRAGETVVTDTNGDSRNASYYQFGAEDTPYANVTMGGLPYTWGGDDPPFSQTYISGSSTAPIGAFSLLYQSSSGQTITDWQVDASMLFMTAGYVNWGGDAIHCDPVFVGYVSAQNTGAGVTTPTTTTTTTTPGTTTSTTTTTPTDGEGIGGLILVAGIVIVVVVVCVLIRRR
jgi:hypothetical protein